MRTIFLLILLAGAATGFLYPWYVTNFSGSEIGTWPVYERGGSFRPVSIPLSAADEPVRVLIDMTAAEPPEFARSSTVLTLTASTGGRTVLAETLSFFEARPREKSPQLREKVYRDEAGVLTGIEAGHYEFAVGRGDVEDIRILSVELTLRRGAGAVDQRLQPVGFALTAIGFIGLVLSLRRRRRERNASSQPPPPRWGRGGSRPDE
ncbi:MAG: hypothetical protein M3Y43_08025 [Pseudomonadota bacterium]|nr:hypothetical protein [Pseudomonadota bacterium]MDQ2705097.1 hypothetical protein [Pseudomonadota bacterium]